MTKEEIAYKKRLEQSFGDKLIFKTVSKLKNGNWRVRAANKSPLTITTTKLTHLIKNIQKTGLSVELTITI